MRVKRWSFNLIPRIVWELGSGKIVGIDWLGLSIERLPVMDIRMHSKPFTK